MTGPTDHDQRETLGPEGPYADSPFKRARPAPLLERAVPVAGAIPSYRPPTARRDLTAGLTVAALAVPSAMAYAELAGLRPVAGLYALLLPTVAYALLGSSRQLIVGPDGSISALVAAAVLSLAAAGSQEAAELAAMLALLVGACFAVARFARLGWLADYFSRPVLIGYVHGVAVVLVIGQVGKLLGLDVSGIEPLDQLGEVVQELGEISWQTTVVGLVALSVLLPLRFVAPRVPAALLVVVGAIVVSKWLDLAGDDVPVVGEIPSGLPSVDVPAPGFVETLQLAPAAVGLFLVAFADEILTARSYAGKHEQHVDVGAELVAWEPQTRLPD